MEYTLIHIVFKKKMEKNFKIKFEHLDFLHSWTYNPQKRNTYLVLYIIEDVF